MAKSKFTDKIANDICLLVSEGSNLHRIGHKKDFPCRDTIHKWLNDFPSFSDNYARARELRGDWRAHEMDETVKLLKKGKIDYQTARIAIDNHKWQAGKENPKLYGDKVVIAGDEANPLTLLISPIDKLKKVLGNQAARLTGPDEDQD